MITVQIIKEAAPKLSIVDQTMVSKHGKSGSFAIQYRSVLVKHLKAILSALKKSISAFTKEYKAELKGEPIKVVEIYTKPLMTKLTDLIPMIEQTTDPKDIENYKYLCSSISSTRNDYWDQFLADSGIKRGSFKELHSIRPEGYNFTLGDALYDAIIQPIRYEDRYLK